MPDEVTRMTASVGSLIAGSGTSSTRTSRRPCHVTAFMLVPPWPQSSGYARLPARRGSRTAVSAMSLGARGSVSPVPAGKKLEGMGKGVGDRLPGLADAPRAAGEVDDQRATAEARHAAREHPVGRVRT